MMEKQIFAALEIADDEIRLILGEFFNTRFNVLKVERVPCQGIINLQIQDKKVLTDTIRCMFANVSNKIGGKIERVLLSIPSKHMRRVSVKVTENIESIDRKVTILDMQRAMRKAMQMQLDSQLALINAVFSKFNCNGISTRRMPIGEICDEVNVQIDLLCADRNLTFDIVSCVEEAGCNVMDVSLDCYAIAKEGALFEQTVEQNVVVVKLEQHMTTMALLYDGKYVSSEVINDGFGYWVEALSKRYDLPMDVAIRLCKYNSRLEESRLSDSPIYIWSRNQITNTISERQLCEEIGEPVSYWINMLKDALRPIVESQRCTVVVLTGEGAEVQGLDWLMKNTLGCEVRKYSPETLGARMPALSCCLGLFYSYKDQLELLGNYENSLNMEEFTKAIQYKKIEQHSSDENTITGKLKSILFDTKD